MILVIKRLPAQPEAAVTAKPTWPLTGLPEAVAVDSRRHECSPRDRSDFVDPPGAARSAVSPVLLLSLHPFLSQKNSLLPARVLTKVSAAFRLPACQAFAH